MYFLIGLGISFISIVWSIIHLRQSAMNYLDPVGIAVVIGGTLAVGVNNNYFGQSIAAGKIQTLRNITGSPFLNAVAVNATKLCYTGGRINNANSGEHALICLARSSGATSLYCGGDSSEFPNRDGTPLSDLPLYESDGVTESYGYQEGKACSANAASNLGEVLLNGPSGIVFDAEGNLYLADTQNHIVRMIKAW